MNLRNLLTASLLASSIVSVPLASTALAKGDGVIPKGTTVTCVVQQKLDSGSAHDDDAFSLELKPGFFGDKSLKGDKLEGHLEGVKPAAKFGKKGAMELVFDDLLTPDGKQIPVQARLLSASALKAQGKGLRNAALILGGAVAGHHIAKKNGKKHGGLMGAAAATAVVLALPGGNVVLPKGSTLKVKFEDTVDPSTAQ